MQYIAVFCGLFYVCVLVSTAFFPVVHYTDYIEYLNMVTSGVGSAHQPFADRVLAPWLARALVAVTGLKPALALGATCLAGWLIVPVLAAAYLLRRNVAIEWAIVAACLPYPAICARFLFVPDSWAICLVLAAFLALEAGRPWLAWASGFGLGFARATSVLALVLRAAVEPKLLRSRLGWGLFAAFAAAVALKALVTPADVGNQHGMNSVLYMLAKTPVNALSNYFGVHIYTNTFPYCMAPVTRYELGNVYMLGKIHTIGLCPINIRPIAISILCYLFIFGVFPWIIARRVLAERPYAFAVRKLTWREMAIFLFAFLLCPAFGLTITRLFVEAYPLLFVAIAALSGRGGLTRPRALAFAGYNLVGFAILLAATPD